MGNWRANFRGGAPTPPRGENVPRPNSKLSAPTMAGPGGRGAISTGAATLGRIALSAAASGGADERDASGRSSNRNITEKQKATSATAMASRSMESAGAPGEAVL